MGCPWQAGGVKPNCGPKALPLGAAHARGIVHRDIKPANIMIDQAQKHVFIMDFGLARHRKHDDAAHKRDRVILGTPAYMSPEQARGDVNAVGPRSDVYSLGVILFEILAGRVPFTGSLAEVLGQVLHVEPQPPGVYQHGVNAQLTAICLKAVAKKPSGRYPSMLALAADLNSFLHSLPGEKTTAPQKPPTLPGWLADAE
jgi:serine/threonine protein kinase